jgi:hypothetical protein
MSAVVPDLTIRNCLPAVAEAENGGNHEKPENHEKRENMYAAGGESRGQVAIS